MKSISLTIVFLVGAIHFDYGQVKDASQHLKSQADKMGQAFTTGDYKTFARYTYPLIVRSMGGTDKMAGVLEKGANDLKAQGMSFGAIRFDEPSAVIRNERELQATIAQHTEIKLRQGRLVNTSTLIAVSADNGHNWTFIDTSNKDLETLRKAMPNLSKALILSPPQPPVRYN